ncbi:MAG: HEXXH motif domain-containing protein, partial [Chloroflexota bacterium]
SFMHVTALDIVNFKAETDPNEKAIWLYLLKRNLPKMEAGDREIKAHIQLDTAGKTFMGAFWAWSEQILAEGRQLLAAHESLIPAAYR